MYSQSTRKAFLQFLFAVTGVLAWASPSFAHHAMGGRTPETVSQGLLSGIAHPIIGVDHLAFLIVIALATMMIRTPARLLVPLGFVAATVAGTALTVSGTDIALVETLVAASLVVGGAFLLMHKNLPALLIGVVAAGFGVFHGYAYGESIIGAENTPLVAYLAGFAIIQYATITGAAFGLARYVAKSQIVQRNMEKLGGIGALLTGGVFMAMSLT